MTDVLPGLVERRPVAGEAYVRRLAWSLYNFEAGDATLKPGHKGWLDENLIPMLATFGARVRLHGTASASGSAGVNQLLSERRVVAVRDYLLKHRLTAGPIRTRHGGRRDRRLERRPTDGTEDARFRAVVVELSFMTGEPVHFDHPNPASRNDGFDNSSEPLQPPWVLVRFERGTRVVRLHNGIGLELVSNKPDVIQTQSFQEWTMSRKTEVDGRQGPSEE